MWHQLCSAAQLPPSTAARCIQLFSTALCHSAGTLNLAHSWLAAALGMYFVAVLQPQFQGCTLSLMNSEQSTLESLDFWTYHTSVSGELYFLVAGSLIPPLKQYCAACMKLFLHNTVCPMTLQMSEKKFKIHISS